MEWEINIELWTWILALSICNMTWYFLYSGTCVGTLRGHEDEVLDVGFDFTGQWLLTASADGTGCCYNAITHNLVSKFIGHEGEISKV